MFLTDDVGLPSELPSSVEPWTSAEAVRRVAELDEVVLSPGVAAKHPLVETALAAGVAVRSELALAAEHVRGRVLAITGTNGKSTVTTLVADALRQAGRRVFAGGNLGKPLCDAASGEYDDLVVEVSSFQLEWPHRLVPAVAAVLNVTPDHLDRHGSFEAYVAAKMNLFANMGPEQAAVLLREETWWRERAEDIRAKISTFGRGELADGEVGTVYTLEPRSVRVRTTRERLLALAEAWPRFPHDVENVAAAAEILRVAGAPLAALERAVACFRPLPHRLALVGTHRGVAYYDDSKATNVGATIKSLEAFEEPVILLAGGSDKGVSFEALAPALGGVRLVIAYGQAGEALVRALRGRAAVERARGFEEAFELAVSRAAPGDVVLLAPACASFDEFRDYGARGDRFIERVSALVTAA